FLMGFTILIDMGESSQSDFVFSQDLLESITDGVRLRLQQSNVPFDSLTTSVLPIRSVGVKGDYRTYEHPIELRVEYQGQRCRVPHQLMEDISKEIVNRI